MIWLFTNVAVTASSELMKPCCESLAALAALMTGTEHPHRKWF